MDNEDTRVPTVHIESGGPIIDDTQLEHWGEKSGGNAEPFLFPTLSPSVRRRPFLTPLTLPVPALQLG